MNSNEIKEEEKKNIFRFESDCSPVGSLFTNEEQKARDVVDTLPHNGHVHDVTDRLLSHKMAALTVVFSILSNVNF